MYNSTLSLTSLLDRVCCQRHAPGRFTPRTDPVPIVYEAGWDPGSVWTGAGNLPPPNWNSIPGARTKTLYQLRYPGSRHMGRYMRNEDSVYWDFCLAQGWGSANKGCGKTVIGDVVQKSLFSCWSRQSPRVWCFALTLTPSNKR
jgi:hypothetical protein